jgi:hypothetical protein
MQDAEAGSRKPEAGNREPEAGSRKPGFGEGGFNRGDSTPV